MQVKRAESCLPNVGDQARLCLHSSESDGDPGFLVSVAAVNRRHAFLEFLPSWHSGEAISMNTKRGQAATLTVAREDSLRVYAGEIRKLGETRLILIPRQPALRLQRRRDFRLPLVRSVEIVRGNCSEGRRIRANLIDLSGGGAQVESASSLAVGELVQFSAPMGCEGYEELVDALVLSCERSDVTSSGPAVAFRARLTFDDDKGRVSLPEWRRDEIVRYVFACQREMLRLRRLLAPAEGKRRVRLTGLSALWAKARGAL